MAWRIALSYRSVYNYVCLARISYRASSGQAICSARARRRHRRVVTSAYGKGSWREASKRGAAKVKKQKQRIKAHQAEDIISVSIGMAKKRSGSKAEKRGGIGGEKHQSEGEEIESAGEIETKKKA